MPTKPTFRDILGDLSGENVRNERRGDWAIALLYRVPSLLFTWVFLRLGLSAIAVSTLGLVVSLAMPAMAVVLPLWLAVWMVCAGGVMFQILDCSDGTLARVTGRTSLLGADLDYFFGMIHYLCLYPSIGLLADRTLGAGAPEIGLFWTTLGAVAVAIRLLARLVREQIAKRQAAQKPTKLKMTDLPFAFVAGLSGLIPFGALGGVYLGAVVVALLIYSMLDLIDGLLPLLDAPYRNT